MTEKIKYECREGKYFRMRCIAKQLEIDHNVFTKSFLDTVFEFTSFHVIDQTIVRLVMEGIIKYETPEDHLKCEHYLTKDSIKFLKKMVKNKTACFVQKQPSVVSENSPIHELWDNEEDDAYNNNKESS